MAAFLQRARYERTPDPSAMAPPVVEPFVQLTCTATGTKSSAFGVKINQCNGSANGGGALVTCSANITNRRVTSGSTSGSMSGSAAPPTDTLVTTATPGSGQAPAFLVGIFLLGFVVVAGHSLLRASRTR